MRWLNVSYAVKFNRAHRYRGTVFQGQFKLVLIQEQSQAVEVARGIHLNPVRIGGLALSKSDQHKARVVGCEKPGRELVKRRLETLREHPWSSEDLHGHGTESGLAGKGGTATETNSNESIQLIVYVNGLEALTKDIPVAAVPTGYTVTFTALMIPRDQPGCIVWDGENVTGDGLTATAS